ncbi:hypothetical protein [Streptomyces sp. NPDC001480]|uniref:hypothetical protein n=1 Tax=Streptomyces sp. NPDC001480 TaxID=3364577 RepID=UPI0036B256B3
MFCEHCGDTDGQETGTDHDERDCPRYATDNDWTAKELEDVLRQTADGSPHRTAAIELLAAHGVWLPRLAQREDLMVADGETGEVYDLDWPTLADPDRAELVGSGSELGILTLAASLADAGVSIRLGDMLSHLDSTNLARVLTAIATANGRPQVGERYVPSL